MQRYNLPLICTIQDCERLFPNTFIISHYSTYEKFDDFYYSIYYAICACFEIKECVEYPIKFKFYIDDSKVYSLSMPKFLLNINAWRPLIELNSLQQYYHQQIEILDESFIVGQLMSDVLRKGLESKVLKVLNDYGITFEAASLLLKTVIERYQEISIEFALLTKGSIWTLENCFLDDYRNSAKIRELNNTVISQDIQTADVELLLQDKYNELITELGNTKNPIWYISKAGNHIKSKQVEELFISYGQIPDVSGNVIPYTMEGNGFATGIINPSTYYVAATGARLSAIMNKTEMGNAGYLSRNLILLSRTMTLSQTMYDCGTKHRLMQTITSSDYLRRLENRWYSESSDGPLELIQFDNCRHLIGKKIYVRSLLTCDGKDEVCHVCYGRDSHLVMNMPGMAIFNTEVYSEPVSQNLLKTKHLLFTVANKLTFNPSFHKYFRFNSGDIFLIDKDEWDSIIPFESLTLRIPEDNIVPLNQNDMIEYNTFGNSVVAPFYVYNSKSKEYDEIEIINYEAMFIDSTSIKMFKLVADKKINKSYYEIPFDTLSTELEGRLLSIDIKNNGLTDNLYALMNLLNKDANKFEDYNLLAQHFFEMLIEANIRCRNIQGEIILNRLIRDANDIYHRPDFSSYQVPAYKILTLNQALLNTEAPTIPFSYQELRRQVLSDDLYTIKTGRSYLDPLYSEIVPTDRFKRLHEKMRQRRKEQKETNLGGVKE